MEVSAVPQPLPRCSRWITGSAPVRPGFHVLAVPIDGFAAFQRDHADHGYRQCRRWR
jgi:hypothetical protein